MRQATTRYRPNTRSTRSIVPSRSASTACLLSVEVQFSRILQTQHHRLLGRSLFCLLPVRLQDHCHSTLALSKKRYAAIVSPQPLHAFGTLAVGVAAIVSINTLARRFRRASPRSSCRNSCSVHVDSLPIAPRERRESTRFQGRLQGLRDVNGRLLHNEMVNLGLLNYKMNGNLLFILIRAEVARAAKAAVTIAKVVGVVSMKSLMADIIRM